MFNLFMFCLFCIFVFLCFVILCFITDPKTGISLQNNKIIKIYLIRWTWIFCDCFRSEKKNLIFKFCKTDVELWGNSKAGKNTFL